MPNNPLPPPGSLLWVLAPTTPAARNVELPCRTFYLINDHGYASERERGREREKRRDRDIEIHHIFSICFCPLSMIISTKVTDKKQPLIATAVMIP